MLDITVAVPKKFSDLIIEGVDFFLNEKGLHRAVSGMHVRRAKQGHPRVTSRVL